MRGNMPQGGGISPRLQVVCSKGHVVPLFLVTLAVEEETWQDFGVLLCMEALKI